MRYQGKNSLNQSVEIKILGIDPGSINCGYGIIKTTFPFVGDSSSPIYVASGKIILAKKNPLYIRLKTLYDMLVKIIREYRPDQMVIEDMFFAKSVKAAISLGHVRGVALLAAASEGLNVYEYSSLEVKKAVTGYGRAEKKQVKDMVERILNLNSSDDTKEVKNLSEDSADALALALCHLNNISFMDKIK